MVPSSRPAAESVQPHPPNRVDATVLTPPPALLPCLLRALVIGLLCWGVAAGAIWWFGRPQPNKAGFFHRQEIQFRSLPVDDNALRAWIESRDSVSEVEIKRLKKSSLGVEVVASQPEGAEQGQDQILGLSYRIPGRQRLSPPWQQLGYGKDTHTMSSSTGSVNFSATLGVSYFLFLLARFLDLGFLIMGLSCADYQPREMVRS